MSSTDAFPVGLGAHAAGHRNNVAFAAVYFVLGCAFVVRLVIRCCRPTPGHRYAAYVAFAAMCLLRVPMFALLAVPAGWRSLLAADILSILGWSFFCAAVFALGYSWSGRIPCVYCMVQFSDERAWWKGTAIYLIAGLLLLLSVIASPLRLRALMQADDSLWTSATFVARASAAAAVAFVGCFIVVVPYTAYIRSKSRKTTRKHGIDHSAVAAMTASGALPEGSITSERGAVLVLMLLGLVLLWESLYRLLVVQNTLQPRTDGWIASQTALGVLMVLPEWIACILVLFLEESNLDEGEVGVRTPWTERPARHSYHGGLGSGSVVG